MFCSEYIFSLTYNPVISRVYKSDSQHTTLSWFHEAYVFNGNWCWLNLSSCLETVIDFYSHQEQQIVIFLKIVQTPLKSLFNCTLPPTAGFNSANIMLIFQSTQFLFECSTAVNVDVLLRLYTYILYFLFASYNN